MKFTRSITLALAVSGLATFGATSALAKNTSAQPAIIPSIPSPPDAGSNGGAQATGISHDLETLRQKHAADLDRAAHDLNVRYAAQLNALLVKAAQAKDYNAVSAINRALKATNYAINHSETVIKPLRDWLMANDFTWVDLFAKGHPRLLFQFNPDGSIKHYPGWSDVESSWGFNHWEIVNGDEFRIFNGSFSLYFKVDRVAKTITLDKAKTPKDHQDKEILFGNQLTPKKAETQPSPTVKPPATPSQPTIQK